MIRIFSGWFITYETCRKDDWVWDGNFNPAYTDEGLYSFKIEDYCRGNSLVEEAVENGFDTESPQTSVCRREWENQKAVVDHFERQLKQVKSNQQSLFQSLSNGFQGDLKKTIAHVIAISQTCKDLESLQAKITKISADTNTKQWAWIVSCNEDDHNVLREAQTGLKEAQERLADTDPLNTMGIQTEQGWIRLYKERIGLLNKNLEARTLEMNKLAAIAKGGADGDGAQVGGQIGSSESVGSHRKGRKMAQDTQKKAKLEPGDAVAGSVANTAFGGVYPFPSVQRIYRPEVDLWLDFAEDLDVETTDADGEFEVRIGYSSF